MWEEAGTGKGERKGEGEEEGEKESQMAERRARVVKVEIVVAKLYCIAQLHAIHTCTLCVFRDVHNM